MTPVNFPESNCEFRSPSDLEESQVMTIRGFCHEIRGGSVDGLRQTVVAWLPTEEERQRILEGHPIYLSVLGGLPAHYLCMDFHTASHPA